MNNTFGIINMGGRIYDAALGRMLQADPFVQEPTASQSFNRYTYVFNNPLSYTDPSGYITLRQGIGMVVGAVLTIYLGPMGANIASAAGAALVGAVVGTYIATDGDISATAKAGFTAVVTAFVMDKMFKPAASSETSATETAGKRTGAGSAGDSVSTESIKNTSPNVGSASQEVGKNTSVTSSNQVASKTSESNTEAFYGNSDVERFAEGYKLNAEEHKLIRDRIKLESKIAKSESIKLKYGTSEVKTSLKKTMKLSNDATSSKLSYKFDRIAEYLEELNSHDIGLLTPNNFTDSMEAFALHKGGKIYISKSYLNALKSGGDNTFTLIHEASHAIGGSHEIYDLSINRGAHIAEQFKKGTYNKAIKLNKTSGTFPDLINNPYNQTWYLKDRLVNGGF